MNVCNFREGSVLMGDLGSDAGSSALSLTAKVLEAILRLLEKIIETWRKNPERELAKMKLQNAKTDLERAKILESLNGKTGYVNYQELKKSGLELSPLSIKMTKAQMKEFSDLCKRENVIFSGMTEKDHTEKNKSGEKIYEIICPSKDLEKVRDIIERLNDEKMLAGIEQRIAELKSKGDAMTEQDKVDIAALQEQKAAIQKNYCDRLNNEMSNNIINGAVTGEKNRKFTLDEALNRLTGRHIDKDIFTIIADANDPSKYIKCHGYQDTFKDIPYIKTEYEVYRGTECTLKTHDGRFEGRPVGYWQEQKDAIQKAGDFSGTFFKFTSAVEYQKWAEAARKQNTQELGSMTKEGEKDYQVIIKELEMKLDENGAKFQDGQLLDKQTGEPLIINENMTEEQRAIVAESTVICKQITNYNELEKVNQELVLAKSNVLTTNEGTEERLTAEAELAQVQNRYDALVETEKQLITDRTEINAVQSEQELRNGLEKSQGIENREHPDTRRTERVLEKEKKQMSLEEAVGKVQDRKAKAAEKANAFGDKQLEKATGKPKTSMSRDDR